MAGNSRLFHFKSKMIVAIFCGILSACGANNTDGGSSSCLLSFIEQTADTQIAPRQLTQNWQQIAQSFQVTQANDITKIRLRLIKIGTISDDITVTLQLMSDASGEPDNTALATTSVLASAISTVASFIEFTFSSAVSLSANTSYWMVLDTDYAASNSNLIQWLGYDSTTGGYENGKAVYKESGTTWLNTVIGGFYDLNFRVGCN